MSIKKRKNDHLQICLHEDVGSDVPSGFERYRLVHNALPEADFDAFSTETRVFGRTVSAPLMVSSITGGTETGTRVNRALLHACAALNIPFAIGSMRVFIENGTASAPAWVRQDAPGIPIFANIGAVQLNYGFTEKECRAAVDAIEADALILHFNPLQELLQPEGDRNFSGLLKKIESLARALPVPLIAKEVGSGFAVPTARRLAEAGIAMIDIAGAGGTSWAKAEAYRHSDPEERELALSFGGWGIPTAECLVRLHEALPEMPLIASGGVASGIDMCKAMHLGAALCGIARPLLPSAMSADEGEAERFLRRFIRQYRIARFLSMGVERTASERTGDA